MNIAGDLVSAFNDGYTQGKADAVVRGEWIYKVKDNGNCSYSVTAKCSECGWDWFSKDGVGNYSAVFGAFITNGKSRPDEAEMFLHENAKANNNLNYCPNCGALMEDKPLEVSNERE